MQQKKAKRDPAQPESKQNGSYFKERLLRDAEKIDQKDIDKLHESVPEKLDSIERGGLKDDVNWLSSLVEKVRALYGMIFDREFKLTLRSKMLIGAALLYFVLPADIVPDFIPGIGYLDDALVLSSLWKMIGSQIEEYQSGRGRRSLAR